MRHSDCKCVSGTENLKLKLHLLVVQWLTVTCDLCEEQQFLPPLVAPTCWISASQWCTAPGTQIQDMEDSDRLGVSSDMSEQQN